MLFEVIDVDCFSECNTGCSLGPHAAQERARKVLSETVDVVVAKMRDSIDRAMALTDQDLAEAADEVNLRQDEDLYPCWAALMRLNHLQTQLPLHQADLSEPLHALVQASRVSLGHQGAAPGVERVAHLWYCKSVLTCVRSKDNLCSCATRSLGSTHDSLLPFCCLTQGQTDL